ncbi:MAG: hypothetical protein HY841_08885 [Bacteroidetes bacterium]|nr:hypothetical protein [Bacteroidota bacterium]
MSEETTNNQEEKQPNPWEDYTKEEIEKNKFQEKIYSETVKWLESDEKIQEYFKNFQSSSIQTFIHGYATQKSRWLSNKPANEKYLQNISVEYHEKALKCLEIIQQKKLFDKQCEWRAEQFTHPSIEISDDFSVWEHNVLNCPLIEPISQNDIDFFNEYLLSEREQELAWLANWQDYDRYKDSFEHGGEDDDFPQWYNYHDFKKGKTSPLLLPDIRGEKEKHYRSIGLAEQRRKREEELKNNPPAPKPLPYLWSGEKEMTAFMKEFEKDKSVFRAYKIYNMTYQKDMDDANEEEAALLERVDDAIYHLKDCYEQFPVFGLHSDWKSALIATAKHWVDVQTSRALPIVYDEYLFRQQCGIAHPLMEEQIKSYTYFANLVKEQILLGRELSGMPKDFNF